MTREKTKRNEEIRSLSKKNGGPLTYRGLAKKYKLDVKTVFDIVNK